MDKPSPLIPAATVILLRDHDNRLETLMLRRNRSLRSFGGVWVFPGGRVDKTDGDSSHSEYERAKIAACREVEEETGFQITPNDLVSLSHWIPPVQEKRRFSTIFFMARCPEGEVKIDEGEIHDYRWICPRTAVANTPDPELRIMPPTYVSLHNIAAFDDVASVIAYTRAQEDEFFETKFIAEDGGFVTLWAPDSGYDTLELTLPGPRRRLTAGPNLWTYENTK